MSLRRITPMVALVAAVLPVAAAGAQGQGQPWQDVTRSPDARARALVAAMTLDEKVQLVHGISVCAFAIGDFAGAERRVGGSGFVPGIARLGVPDVNYTDAGAGVTNCGGRPNGESTMLPAPLARASSWDPAVTRRAGALMGTEARVQGFAGLLNGVVDIIREPRWGRAFEAPGEDPVLNAALVAAEIRGVQRRRVVATIKHFALNYQETNRSTVDARVDERTLRQLDLLPYELAIPASGVGNVMCSYNAVNGRHACENATLLTRILKREWGFRGQVQSDWGATHSTVGSALAGLDEEQFASEFFASALRSAVESGSVPRSRLDDMVRRKLRTLLAVGVYDDPPRAGGAIDRAAGAAAAERIAEQSMVLLKNRRAVLPLSTRTGSIAVIGSHADAGVLSGSGSSQVTPPGGQAVGDCDPSRPGGGGCEVWAKSSPLEAIRRQAPGATVGFADGTDPAAAEALARSADVAIVFANEWRREGEDRETLALPKLGPPNWPVEIDQEALIRRVAAANPRTIVVLETGGPVTMPWAGDVKAILEAWYPGSRGGAAIADTLFGDNNPSGKLTVTFPRREADTPSGAGPVSQAAAIRYGRLAGYRWYDAERIAPRFEFGFGLSYTSFRYSGIDIGRRRGGLEVGFTVRNTGDRSGAEVAQVYAELPPAAREARRLVGFEKVRVPRGKARRVTVRVPDGRLRIWDAGRDEWRTVPGIYRISVGRSSRDLPLRRTVRRR